MRVKIQNREMHRQYVIKTMILQVCKWKRVLLSQVHQKHLWNKLKVGNFSCVLGNTRTRSMDGLHVEDEENLFKILQRMQRNHWFRFVCFVNMPKPMKIFQTVRTDKSEDMKNNSEDGYEEDKYTQIREQYKDSLFRIARVNRRADNDTEMLDSAWRGWAVTRASVIWKEIKV